MFPGAWLVADSGGMTGADGRPGQEAGAGRRWDVALSFAGAQRDYVERVARELKVRGVRCFYDADEQIDLWGKYLAEELPRIYAQESAAVVVFISADYAGRDWTRLERRAAFSRAVAEAGVYVLPARFDDSELPGLLPDIVTVDLRRYTPAQFAELVAAKVAGLTGSPPGGPRAGAGPAAAGRLLAQVSDPFALEVHRPVQPENPQPGLPELPAYVPREHDQVLAQVVRAAASGPQRDRGAGGRVVHGQDPGLLGGAWPAAGRAGAVAGVASDRPDPPRCRAARAAGHRAADGGVAERGPVLPGRRTAGWASGSPPGCGSCCATRPGPRCWSWPRCGRSTGTP